MRTMFLVLGFSVVFLAACACKNTPAPGAHDVPRPVAAAKTLKVREAVSGIRYDIPAGDYEQVAENDQYYFFRARSWSDSAQGLKVFDDVRRLSVPKGSSGTVCVVTIKGEHRCYSGNVEVVDNVTLPRVDPRYGR